ncbi:MAG: hypothetical protein LQ350_004476 [Teloschistes chrysophthalmus]|nr:MAG: hypothetical protein LQ350_004476 [Niorma chrysophthalma]
MTSLASRDVPILVISSAASSERRVNPSWTISQLKIKLEPITGIPPSAQILTLRLPASQESTAVASSDEDVTQIAGWSLTKHAELHVTSSDPSSGFAIASSSSVPKYEMSAETYASLPDTVLAYKKTHQIGRFDPHATENVETKVANLWREVAAGGINVGARCILPPSTTRRGTVAYVGIIPEIPGVGPWIGVRLDEPAGKNDGSLLGKQYFDCEPYYGVFVRPERVEVGDWRELSMDEDDDMEEI